MLDLDAKTRQDAVRDFLKNMQFTAREFTAREWSNFHRFTDCHLEAIFDINNVVIRLYLTLTQ